MPKQRYKLRKIKGKYYYEHRIIMEENIGRKLKTHEQVHHINGIRNDNRIENLEIVDIRKHGGEHAREYWDKNKYIPKDKRYCEMCGKEIKYVSKYGKKWFEKSKFCGIKCNIKNARNHQNR